jgi:hypothetical protein
MNELQAFKSHMVQNLVFCTPADLCKSHDSRKLISCLHCVNLVTDCIYCIKSSRLCSCTLYSCFLFKAGAWPLGQNLLTPFAVPQELEKSVQMVSEH